MKGGSHASTHAIARDRRGCVWPVRRASGGGRRADADRGNVLCGRRVDPEGEWVGQNFVYRFTTIFGFDEGESEFVGIVGVQVTIIVHPSGAQTRRYEIVPGEFNNLWLASCGERVESTIVFMGHIAPGDDTASITGSFFTIGGEGPQAAGTFTRGPDGIWTYSGHAVCES